MNNVGESDLSNNFHEFGETSGAGAKLSEMLVKPTFSLTPHRQIMENVGFTNILNSFHDFGETTGAGAIVAVIVEIV